MPIATHVKLGVNIDHIATLRQARKDIDPDPVEAARVAKNAGADMIVCHLRRDRRHIQDADLARLCELKGETHLEISSDMEMVKAAIKAKPSSVCIVPERPGEVSTEGGLDLDSGRSKGLKESIARLRGLGIEVSLFVDPGAATVRAAKALGADTVELCTLSYARAEGKTRQRAELENLALAATLAREMGLHLHAGHDLDYHNVSGVARLPNMQALNIGFAIVARAVFVGLKTAVAEMKRLIA